MPILRRKGYFSQGKVVPQTQFQFLPVIVGVYYTECEWVKY